jgi:hypothetical protein
LTFSVSIRTGISTVHNGFRIIVAIPILILLAAVGGGEWRDGGAWVAAGSVGSSSRCS